MLQRGASLNQQSQIGNLKSSSVLSDYHPAKRADHLSDGTDSSLCIIAFLPKVCLGVGGVCYCRNHRRARWALCATFSSTIAAGPNSRSNSRQNDARNVICRAVNAGSLSQSVAKASAGTFLGNHHRD